MQPWRSCFGRVIRFGTGLFGGSLQVCWNLVRQSKHLSNALMASRRFFIFVFCVSYSLFTLFPWIRSLYPLAFFSEDTLCVDGGSILTRRPYRCENAVGAIDIALLLSVLALLVTIFFFLRQGGVAMLLQSQKTKKFIENGGVCSAFFAAAAMLAALSYALKFYVFDQNLLPHVLFLGIPCFVSVIILIFHGAWLALRAGHAMIFFYITGRFPSWLDDLSP
ncbi:MAG: hypothetical protein ACR2IG_07035 [Roseomonas sp.]